MLVSSTNWGGQGIEKCVEGKRFRDSLLPDDERNACMRTQCPMKMGSS